MVEIKKEGILMLKTQLRFEEEGVLNPAAIRENDIVHLFYRAVKKHNFSTIGYCRLKGPLTIEMRMDEPLLFPENDYESQGLEDPRIVKIEYLYYLTYTAFDGVNALGALATSIDLIHWKKHGILVPQMDYEEFIQHAESRGNVNQKYLRFNEGWGSNKAGIDKRFIWDKNLIFFPRKINGKFFFLHRVRPDIQLVSVHELEELTCDFWIDYFRDLNHHVLLSSEYRHEVSYIGGGCPPIETEHGWLLIYHGVHDTPIGYVYSACAALLDLDDPQKEIARLPNPLFVPEHEWELKGEVNNVCFPTGAVVFEDTLYIYYGAADERIATVSMSLSSLLNELLLYTKKA